MLRNFMLLGVAAIALSACGKKTVQTELPRAPEDTVSAPSAPSRPATAVSNAPVPGSQADFLASVTSDRIYFDTDKSDIDAEDEAVLKSQAKWLARYPQKPVTIEGHCDERGTREYNLALGERRANAAKNYLVSLGVAAGRISTISLGKERPVALGSNEEAWAQNRRAVTVTID